MSRRLFIAIPLPETIKNEFVRGAEQFQMPKHRLVAQKNWHITILFLGNTPTEKISLISEQLQILAGNTNKFTLITKSVTLAPPRREPAMLWGTFKGDPAFGQLVRATTDALDKVIELNFARADAWPHVTLARFHYFRGPRQPVSCAPLNFTVDAIELMELQLQPEGAHYTVLETYKLS